MEVCQTLEPICRRFVQFGDSRCGDVTNIVDFAS